MIDQKCGGGVKKKRSTQKCVGNMPGFAKIFGVCKLAGKRLKTCFAGTCVT